MLAIFLGSVNMFIVINARNTHGGNGMIKLPSHSVFLKVGVAGILLVGIAIYFLGMKGDAEEILHHGSTVNSEAGYRECLSCHDGVVAPNISPCLGPVCKLKDDHSVNKPYPPPDKVQNFAPVGTAEIAGIKFVDGRIDCISCHNLLNPNRYHLRVENRNSLACHLK
jgi:hypothetical protein